MEGVLAVLGLVLELGGIGVALWGLEELSAELFPSRPLPHRAAFRRVKRALGVKPSAQNLQVHASGHADISAELRVQGHRGPPPDDAPLADWNLYWESRMNNLREGLDGLEKGNAGGRCQERCPHIGGDGQAHCSPRPA